MVTATEPEMPKVRPVRLTDLVALLSLAGSAEPNRAVTQDSLGRGQRHIHFLESAVEQWFSFARGRRTWVSVRGQTVRGLVSARPRVHPSVWEVVCLMAAVDDEETVCLALLEELSRSAARAGVEKVFLRLPADSDTLVLAKKAGFVPYASEQVMHGERPGAGLVPTGAVSVRRCSAADFYPVFRLYEAAVPPAVRRVEAATFREWQAAREARRRYRQELVCQRHNAVVAWLGLSGRGTLGRFELLLHPDHLDVVDDVLAVALTGLARCHTLLSLLAHYQRPVIQRLQELGFHPGEEYVRLARRIAGPVMAEAAVRASPTRAYSSF